MAVKQFVFQRREAELPSDFAGAVDPDSLFAGGDIDIAEQHIAGFAWKGRSAGRLKLEACLLEKVSFSECSFGSLVLKDVRFVGCDLANLKTRGLTMARVEFVNCRMTGFTGGETEGRDVLFSDGDQRYSQFRFSHFKGTEFLSCNLEDADLKGTDLTGARFRSCNLRNADLEKARLQDADLRGSSIEGLRVSMENLRGMLVDPSQAMILAQLLGIRLE